MGKLRLVPTLREKLCLVPPVARRGRNAATSKKNHQISDPPHYNSRPSAILKRQSLLRPAGLAGRETLKRAARCRGGGQETARGEERRRPLQSSERESPGGEEAQESYEPRAA
jgi:hypothetical protein